MVFLNKIIKNNYYNIFSICIYFNNLNAIFKYKNRFLAILNMHLIILYKLK